MASTSMSSAITAAAAAQTAAARRRVVVTGMGAVTPLGRSFEASWKALLRNENNHGAITTLQQALQNQGLAEDALKRELEFASQLPCQVAAPVLFQNLDDEFVDNRTTRFVQMALQAGREAMQQADLESWLALSADDDDDIGNSSSQNDDIADLILQKRQQRVGVCIGSGMSGVREIVESARATTIGGGGTGSYRKLSPHFVPKVLSNSAAGRLSIAYHLKGPNHSASTACAAGSHAIGDAFRCIQYDNADIMLAGGAEACIDPLSMAGFCRLRALSTIFNDNPHQASRPFDKQRDGFVMGEGAAVLVLEELQHALDRQVPILAELTGYGLSGDGHHITAPDPNGLGAELAMRMALQEAGLDDTTDSVGYVNAHATSTPKGDEIEARVIDRIFCHNSDNGHQQRRKKDDRLLVSSTKGATGHLLGAAGAIEAAFTVQSLYDQIVPPTSNLEEVDEVVDFEHVRNVTSVQDMEAAMSNSFGFGGTNASLIFRRWHS